MVRDAHTPCMRLARFTLEDHAYGAYGLPKTFENALPAFRKRPNTTVLQSICLVKYTIFIYRNAALTS